MFNLKSKTMKNVRWSFISLAISAISHLLLRIVLGNELGPAGLGTYTLVFTIYLFGLQFSGFGIGAALTKYIAQYQENLPRIKEFLISGILGSLTSGTVLGILLFLLSSIISIQLFHNPEITDLLKITAFCFPFMALQKAILGTLNGLHRMKMYAVADILQNVSIMVVSLTLVMVFDMGVKGAVIGYVVPTIMVGILSPILVREHLSTRLAIMPSVLKELSWFGFYIVLGNSIGMINSQIGNLMVGYYMNETEVGYYAVAIIFIYGITLLPDAVQRVTSSKIAEYYGKKDCVNIRRLIRETMFKVSLITVVIALFLALFGKVLIGLIFTDEFIPAYAPLLILIIGYSFHAPFVSVGAYLSSIGKVYIAFRISFVCFVFNIFFNIILIPRFGLLGAASAISLTLVLSTLINLYFIQKYTSTYRQK